MSTDGFFHERSRELQDRFDTRRLADRIEEVLLHDRFDPSDRAFVESRDMFFLATADEQGRPQVSYKGGDVGFVKVVDDATLAFPNYNGNGMYLSMGNIAANPHVGMLFIDFERRHRMRVNGEASIHLEDPWSTPGPRRSSSFGCGRARSSPTARATSTACRRWKPPRSFHGRTARRRCRSGSGTTGRSTCCPPTTRPATRTRRSVVHEEGRCLR